MSAKIFLLVIFAISILAPFHQMQAQQAAKIPKIGFLRAGSESAAIGIELFHREFRKLGYVEGKNISFESRYGENNFDRLPPLAEELVGLKVDVLVTNSTPAALAAKNATRTIPIIFLGVSDPVAVGLVDSFARPGGNVTGFSNIAAGVGRQAARVTQGDRSQANSSCGAVGSKGSRLDTTMERKPNSSPRTRSAASFYGS